MSLYLTIDIQCVKVLLLFSVMILDQKATPAIWLLPILPRRDLMVGPVRDLLCSPKLCEGETGQPETCSETGFAILDRKVGKKRDEG